MAAIIEQDTVILKRLKDHALKRSWHGYREFRLARYGNYGNSYDNWVGIYCLNRNELVLLLVATGSHEVLNKN